MGKDAILQHIGLGAAAGLVGTAAVQAVRSATGKLTPRTTAQVRQAPGTAGTTALGAGVKTATSTLLGFSYGSTGVALYTALRKEPSILLDGAALGLGLWAVGRLGWLPHIAPETPELRRGPGQIAMSMAQHAIYGVAAVGAYRRLRRSLG